MANVDDVAAAILRRTGHIDTFRLQKLTYYCQAWHLVWEDEPLFTAKIEAWANGPVVPKLYQQHRRRYSISEWSSGDDARLGERERTTIDAVVDFYGSRTGQELAQLTHQEAPWQAARARAGLMPGQRGNEVIELSEMLEYYGSLV